MKYPTKEEIENCKKIPRQSQIEEALKWKEIFKNQLEKPNERKLAIICLCYTMIEEENPKCPKYVDIQFHEDNKNIPSSCYIESSNRIYLKTLSIITALHETAHALYGADETIACSWSTKLFKEIFPEEYNKLHWEGHMLKK